MNRFLASAVEFELQSKLQSSWLKLGTIPLKYVRPQKKIPSGAVLIRAPGSYAFDLIPSPVFEQD